MWGEGEGRDRETQRSDCLAWRDIADWWGPGGSASEDPRRGRRRKSRARGRSRRAGFRGQSPAEPSPEDAGRLREGRVLPHPAHRWCCQNEGWEGKQEEVLTWTWEPKQRVPVAAPQETAGLGQESKARRRGLLAFPLSAPAPPHSLCHTMLFSPRSVTGGAIFPNTAEDQPLPPTRNPPQLLEGVRAGPARR